jgi:hypothetical protein
MNAESEVTKREDKVSLCGYSERGMINALCGDMTDLSMVRAFLSWIEFPHSGHTPCLSNIAKATLLVEQSFSDFGDLDLLVMLEHDQFVNIDGCQTKRQAFMIEAKVSTDTASWITIESRLDEYLRMLDGGEGSTSNLFVQLHRKARLVEVLRTEKLPGRILNCDPLTPQRRFGENSVVTKAINTLRPFVADGIVWYCGILPDSQDALADFVRASLGPEELPIENMKLDPKKLGVLSWQKISHEIREGAWRKTKESFDWNEGQIFRHTRRIEHLIKPRQVCMYGSRNANKGEKVYVVPGAIGRTCRVAFLEDRTHDFFWRTETVDVSSLVPCTDSEASIVTPWLPKRNRQYKWTPGQDIPRSPIPNETEGIKDSETLIVTGPSWYKSRVRGVNDDDASQGVLVFTRHLRRAEQSGQ